MSSKIGSTVTRGRKSPRLCETCGKVNFNLFRYGSTGITFSTCSECGKRVIKETALTKIRNVTN